MSYDVERAIYQTLIEGGLTPEGAAGSMGNMKAESGMISNIAQRGTTTLSDEQYTAAADAGMIDFIHDSVGYGLCQWTYYTRKAELLQFAKSNGVSVGDFQMQTKFYLKELQVYPGVAYTLSNSHDLKQCSDIVCTEFERPAYNNLDDRYKFALEFYERFKDLQVPGLSAPSFATSVDSDPKPSPTQNAFNAQMTFSGLLSNLVSKITGKKSLINAQMPVLKEGDQGAGVAAIQVALKYHQVDLGTEGTLGLWEPGTTRGVKMFQLDNNIPVTGELDAETWSKLMQ